MAERTVKVSLILQAQQYLAEWDKVQKKTRESTKDGKASLEEQQQAFTLLGQTALIAGTAIAAGIGLAVGRYAQFDKAMSAVSASTRESAGTLNLLRDAAIEAGAKTVFTATEAANAIDELAKAGISTADILGGALAGALDLASAGGLGVARAAAIMATSMTQFKRPGTDAAKIADLLAAGAGKAQGSVDDLAQALNQGGLVAAQTGLTLEETTGTLAAFASAGLLGSDAGTSFKTMLQRLTPNSAEARKEMDRLGISAYDAQGKFIGMEQFAGNLKSSLSKLTDEQRSTSLGIIFGSDAVRAASVIYNQGSEGIGSWIKKTDDAGYAAETARLKLDNLAGDVEKLGGAFDTALIKTGSAANDVLRSLVQGVTGLVDGFGSAPPLVQATALGIGAVTAGVALLGGGLLVAVPQIAEFRAAMATLNITAGQMGKWAVRGGAIALGISGLVGVMQSYTSSVTLAADESARLDAMMKTRNYGGLSKEFTDAAGGASTFQQTLNSLYTDDFWTSYAAGPQQINGLIKGMTFGVVDLGAAMDRNKSKLAELSMGLGTLAKTDFPAAVEQFKLMVSQTDGSDRSIQQLLNALPEYTGALRGVAAEAGRTLSAQELLDLAFGRGELAANLARDAATSQAVALGALSGKAINAGTDISKLADTIRGFGSTQLDVNSTTRQLEAAVDDLSKSVQDNGTTLDVTSAAGRSNQAALDAVASSTFALAAATVTQTGNQQDANRVIDDGRVRLIDMLGQFGITGQAAQDYADKLGLIPRNVETATAVYSTEAENRARALRDMINSIPTSKAITLTVNSPNALAFSDARYTALGRADGGAIYGPGGPRDDRVPVWASNGEHMLTARDVNALGGQSAVYRFRSALNAGLVPRYADGGAIGRERVQYIPASPIRGGSSGVTATGNVTYEQHFHMPPIPTTDPQAAATVIGREFARQAAG